MNHDKKMLFPRQSSITYLAKTDPRQHPSNLFEKYFLSECSSTVDSRTNSASLKKLKAIPKIVFEKCFNDWKKRCSMFITSKGDYFKDDNINVDETLLDTLHLKRNLPLFF